MFENVNTIEGLGWGTAMTDEGPVLYISIPGEGDEPLYVIMPIIIDNLRAAVRDLENDRRVLH